ncbi:MFS transporter [Sulfurimonas sp.]|nr:MFS transporter [Sulfurimonas sp.]
MKQYIDLLKEEHVLKRLSIIQLIAYFGAWFSNVAIYTLLIELHVTPSIVAFVAMLHFLAGVIQAPISGSIIDSMKPKKLLLILITFEVVATFLLILVNNISDLWLLYTLIFIKMAAASFYFTTEMSLLPKLLSGDKLQKANELHSIIWSLSYTLGMGLSGFVVYLFGIKFAFILDSFMFMIGLYLLYKTEIHVEVKKSTDNLLQMMRETFSYIKRTPQALHLMLIHSFVGLTAFDALVALMVDKYYASVIATSLALGLLHASRAIGLVIGPLLLSRFTKNRYISYIFIAQAFSVWLWAYLMKDFYMSLFASVIVGLFTTTLWSYTYTLLQKNIEEKYYGRIVAYNDMLFLSSAAFTSFMIGFLATSNYSLEAIAVIIGFGFILGGLYFAWILKSQKLKEIS